ncbi:MAG: M14 family zinc carboxypeptidase [bacterium]
MKNYLVKIFGKRINEVNEIIDKGKGRRISAVRRNIDGGFRATAIIPKKEIEKLNLNKRISVEDLDKKKPLASKKVKPIIAKETKELEPLPLVKIIGDSDLKKDESQSRVRIGNRYLDPDEDNNSKFYNIEEIEYALSNCENYFIKKFRLNELTHENRECHYVKISLDNKLKKKGIYIIGGVHGDEWVPPDALVFFLEQLSDAYRNKKNITLGNYICSFKSVKKIIENLCIYLFPQVNPDGRFFSQTSSDNTGRKNRRPETNLCKIETRGVDINRNYNILWDFPQYFSSDFSGQMNKDKCDRNYIGPSPFSEPETRNVKFIFDYNLGIEFFVDIHSGGNLILYNWSNDMYQSENEDMSFKNCTYWGMYGNRFDIKYLEYVCKDDTAIRIKLAEKMNEGIFGVNGVIYQIQPSINYDPVSGSSTDYFDSLSYVDKSKPKVHSYTIECATEHQPDLREREIVIKEVTAALLELCKSVSGQ